MNTNKINKRFINKLIAGLVCSLLLCFSLPNAASEREPLFGLFIKPKSCVIKAKNEICEAIIEVQWQLKNKQSVCLFIEEQNRMLACWQDKSFINESFSIDISDNVNFQLKDKKTSQLLYSAPFSLYLKLVKYRKKRRNPWSFY